MTSLIDSTVFCGLNTVDLEVLDSSVRRRVPLMRCTSLSLTIDVMIRVHRSLAYRVLHNNSGLSDVAVMSNTTLQ